MLSAILNPIQKMGDFLKSVPTVSLSLQQPSAALPDVELLMEVAFGMPSVLSNGDLTTRI